MTIAIPELVAVEQAVSALAARVEQLAGEVQPQHQWWTLRQACAAKRGVEPDGAESFYGTVRGNHSLQPGRGKPDAMLGGRRVWRWETVRAWIDEVDPPVRVRRSA